MYIATDNTNFRFLNLFSSSKFYLFLKDTTKIPFVKYACGTITALFENILLLIEKNHRLTVHSNR
jgi:hypothetical protein